MAILSVNLLGPSIGHIVCHLCFRYIPSNHFLCYGFVSLMEPWIFNPRRGDRARLKVHDWKSCVPQKGTGGSNPPLSAIYKVKRYGQ